MFVARSVWRASSTRMAAPSAPGNAPTQMLQMNGVRGAARGAALVELEGPAIVELEGPLEGPADAGSAGAGPCSSRVSPELAGLELELEVEVFSSSEDASPKSSSCDELMFATCALRVLEAMCAESS